MTAKRGPGVHLQQKLKGMVAQKLVFNEREAVISSGQFFIRVYIAYSVRVVFHQGFHCIVSHCGLSSGFPLYSLLGYLSQGSPCIFSNGDLSQGFSSMASHSGLSSGLPLYGISGWSFTGFPLFIPVSIVWYLRVVFHRVSIVWSLPVVFHPGYPCMVSQAGLSQVSIVHPSYHCMVSLGGLSQGFHCMVSHSGLSSRLPLYGISG